MSVLAVLAARSPVQEAESSLYRETNNADVERQHQTKVERVPA